MPETTATTGNLPRRPGPVGRAGRIGFALFLGWYAIRFTGAWLTALAEHSLTMDAENFTAVVKRGNLGFYGLAILSLLALPVFARRKRLVMAGALTILLIGLDVVLAGSWWGLPLALFWSAVITASLVYFALAHVAAGWMATPG